MPHISFKRAKDKGYIKPGARIVSYPDHKGESHEGVILDINEAMNEIAVSYADYGRAILKLNGQLLAGTVDTNLDINLIEIE